MRSCERWEREGAVQELLGAGWQPPQHCDQRSSCHCRDTCDAGRLRRITDPGEQIMWSVNSFVVPFPSEARPDEHTRFRSPPARRGSPARARGGGWGVGVVQQRCCQRGDGRFQRAPDLVLSCRPHDSSTHAWAAAAQREGSAWWTLGKAKGQWQHLMSRSLCPDLSAGLISLGLRPMSNNFLSVRQANTLGETATVIAGKGVITGGRRCWRGWTR